MKKLFATLPALLAAGVVHAQGMGIDDPSVQTEIRRAIGIPPASAIIEQSQKPNEIRGRHVTYSGIAVQLFKTDNPLQLINPLAPARYGSADQNVVRDSVSAIRDPITRRSAGFKVFSIEF